MVLAHAAAPFTTCQASSAIVKDQALLDTWVLQAAAAGTLKKPVQVAAEQGWWHLCSQLLTNMVFSDSRSQHCIALYYAAKAGQVELVQQLLDKGAWMDSWSYPVTNEILNLYTSGRGSRGLSIFRDIVCRSHPLIAPASNGHAGVCKLLLGKHLHPDVVYLSLCGAATGGHLSVAELMLKELQRQVADGELPVHALGALLASECLPYSADLPYPTCMVAAAAGGNPAIAQLLLDLGVSFGQHWEQALAEATSRGHSEVVGLLLSKAPPGFGDRDSIPASTGELSTGET
jgi:hypothetical protein